MDGFQLGQICGGLVIGFLIMAGYWLLLGLFTGVGRLLMGPRRNTPAFYQAPYSEDVADNEAGPLLWRPEDDPYNDRTVYESFDSLLADEPKRADWWERPGPDVAENRRRIARREVNKLKREKSKYEDIAEPKPRQGWK